MSEYKGVGTKHTIVHHWADNTTLNRLCVRLDDNSWWMFGVTSDQNWHNGDTVEVIANPPGFQLRNTNRGGVESAKFMGYVED